MLILAPNWLRNQKCSRARIKTNRVWHFQKQWKLSSSVCPAVEETTTQTATNTSCDLELSVPRAPQNKQRRKRTDSHRIRSLDSRLHVSLLGDHRDLRRLTVWCTSHPALAMLSQPSPGHVASLSLTWIDSSHSLGSNTGVPTVSPTCSPFLNLTLISLVLKLFSLFVEPNSPLEPGTWHTFLWGRNKLLSLL